MHERQVYGERKKHHDGKVVRHTTPLTVDHCLEWVCDGTNQPKGLLREFEGTLLDVWQVVACGCATGLLANISLTITAVSGVGDYRRLLGSFCTPLPGFKVSRSGLVIPLLVA